jgi:hypothetical protein
MGSRAAASGDLSDWYPNILHRSRAGRALPPFLRQLDTVTLDNRFGGDRDADEYVPVELNGERERSRRALDLRLPSKVPALSGPSAEDRRFQ